MDYSKFKALAPFFAVIEATVKNDVDGGKFFDLLDENVEMEFMFPPPGSPAGLKGRQAIIDSFAGYGDILTLDTMACTSYYKTDKPNVVIIEYAGQGSGVQTGKPYDQHYLSVLTIKDRKIVHWRDYWDPIVALEAIGGNEALLNACYATA